jgi:hypothetical protein
VQKSDPKSSIAFSLLGSLPCHLQQARTHARTHSTSHPQSYQPRMTHKYRRRPGLRLSQQKWPHLQWALERFISISFCLQHILVNCEFTLSTALIRATKFRFQLNLRMSVFCVTVWTGGPGWRKGTSIVTSTGPGDADRLTAGRHRLGDDTSDPCAQKQVARYKYNLHLWPKHK